MPIYEYKCADCGEVFEVFQKVTDPPPATHSCGGTQITRLLSNSAFVLKGTGWYITDYARKSTPETGSSSKASGEVPKAEGQTAAAAPAKESASTASGGEASTAKPQAKND